MRIAAVLDADGDTIVPLSDGPAVAILDSERGTVEKHDNPGWPLTTGRRPATTQFLIAQGVEAVCSVPETFCANSLGAAVQGGLKFIRLPAGTKFSQLVADPAPYLRNMVSDLPAGELFVRLVLPGKDKE